MNKFLELIKKNKYILFDGSLATEIYNRGIYINQSFEALNLFQPYLIKKIHTDYLNAGAMVLTTNTFGANRIKLQHFALAEKVEEINLKGVALAMEIASSQEVPLGGTVGPLGREAGEITTQEAVVVFSEQIKALIKGGVDFIILESFCNLEELLVALDVAKSSSNLPVIASFTITEDFKTPTGIMLEEFALKLESSPADFIGLNCTVASHIMLEALKRLRPLTHKKILIKPDAGAPRDFGGRNIHLATPEYIATYARFFFQSGAEFVGGCCGITPVHIKAIREGMKSFLPSKIVVKTLASPDKMTPKEVKSLEEKSNLAKKLAGKEFVRLVEVVPPRGWKIEKIISTSAQLAKSGVDALNIPDGPRATLRMSPLALGVAIQQNTSIEVVLHFCCRDRNILAIQADLLGAFALGIKNLLLITGDPPKLGDYPDASSVFDVDAIGLVKIVKELNQGRDIGGKEFSPPTNFLLGVGVNPDSINLDYEMERFRLKVEAGAEFAITQPVFDVEKLKVFLKLIKEFHIPIIAGIWPLTSYRNAMFMHTEVPGVQVPLEIRERMKRADAKGNSLEEGASIAKEIMQEIKPLIAGVQVSAPLGKFSFALEIIS